MKAFILLLSLFSLSASASGLPDMECNTVLKTGRKISVHFSPAHLIAIVNDEKLYTNAVIGLEERPVPNREGQYTFHSEKLFFEKNGEGYMAWLQVEKAMPKFYLGLPCTFVMP